MKYLFLALALIASPAYADPVDVDASVSAVSQYRSRGISPSSEVPALQGTFDIEHESGFYVGGFGTTLGRRAASSADIELDLVAGYRSGGFDVGVMAYVYPGSEGKTNYLEAYAGYTHSFGSVTGNLFVAYTPEQNPVQSGDNIWVNTKLSGNIPGTPLVGRATLGYSNGAQAPGGDYLDWTLGVDYVRGPLTFNVSYVDTDVSASDAQLLGYRKDQLDATVLVGLTLSF
jgi:uncharacterized protein (TIGR02001 family)